MSKLPDPRPGFDAQGWAVYNELAGPRGAVGAMYLALLNHPALAQHIGHLGTFLRFAGTLPGDVRELAILATARSLAVEYEWQQHLPTALAAGLQQDVIDQLQRGDIAAAAQRGDIADSARHSDFADSTQRDDIADSARHGASPAAPMTELFADVWQTARHVAAQERLPDALQQRLQQALGLQGMVELVALCGFYRCIASVVIAFDVAPLDSAPRAAPW